MNLFELLKEGQDLIKMFETKRISLREMFTITMLIQAAIKAKMEAETLIKAQEMILEGTMKAIADKFKTASGKPPDIAELLKAARTN